MPHAQQVDGVVRALLGGDVSSDMRSILLSGDHPMLEQARSEGSITDSTAAPELSGSLSPAMPAPMRGRMRGEMRTARRNEPQGLAQIVGLALGSPEFQRR